MPVYSTLAEAKQNHAIVMSRPKDGYIKYGFEFLGFDDWDAVIASDGLYLYEDFSDSSECKPYLDYERYFEYVTASPTIVIDGGAVRTRSQRLNDKLVANHKRRFAEQMRDVEEATVEHMRARVVHSMAKLGQPVDADDVLFVSASGFDKPDRYKLSLHIIVDAGVAFRTPLEAKALASHITFFAEDGDSLVKFIDMSVYKLSPKMRCAGSRKDRKDKRVLVPLQERPATAYMIGHVGEAPAVVDVCAFLEACGALGIGAGKKDKKTREQTAKEFREPKAFDETDVCLKAVQRAIDKVVPSAVLTGVKDKFYSYRRDNSLKCPFGLKHDKQGVYCFVDENRAICLGCRSDRCKKVKTIGRLTEPSYFDTKHDNHLDYCTRYNLPMPGKKAKPEQEKVAKYIDGFIGSNDKVLCVRSPYDTGKTSVMMRVMDRSERILIVSHRISFSMDLRRRFKKYGFEMYNDKKHGDLNALKRLVISPESMKRLFLGGRVTKYDLVILDESESVLSQFYAPTHKHDRVVNFDDFHRFVLRQATKILCLDNDLDQKTIDFIAKYPYRTMVNSVSVPSTKNVVILRGEKSDKKERQREQYYKDEVVRALGEGKNIVIVSMSATFCVTMREYIYEKMPALKEGNLVACHTAEGDDEVKKILNDVTDGNGWGAYRALIFSPTVGAGIDFSVKHYDRMFAYLANTAGPKTLLQMLNRVRHTTDNDVLTLTAPSMNKQTNARLYTLEDARYYHDYIDQTAPRTLSEVGSDEDSIYVEDTPKHMGLYTALQYHEIRDNFLNKSEHNYVSALAHILAQKGQELRFTDVPEGVAVAVPEDPKKKFTNSKLLVRTKDIDRARFQELIEQEEKTEAEKLELNRFKIKTKTLGAEEMGDDLLESYLAHKSKVMALVGAVSTKDVATYDFDDFDDKEHARKVEVLGKLTLGLGVKFGDRKDVAVDLFDETVKKVKVDQNVRSLFGLTRQKEDKPYLAVKAILGHFGIDFGYKRGSTRNAEGKTENTIKGYTVSYSDDVLDLMSLMYRNGKIAVAKDVADVLRTRTKHHTARKKPIAQNLFKAVAEAVEV